MIYLTSYDKGDNQRLQIQITLKDKAELEALRQAFKKMYKTSTIYFNYYEHSEENKETQEKVKSPRASLSKAHS